MLKRIREIGLQAAWLKLKNLVFPKDSQVIMAASTNGAYEYLKRYRYVIKEERENKVDKVDVVDGSPICGSKTIWTCWLQGETEAPALVKRCLSSLRKWRGDYEVVLIDETNLHDYVSFPDYIEEKYRKGIISRTHYSDLLRVELLYRYGGIWIDSTFLLMGELPVYIEETQFFCYQRRPFGHLRISNPLLKATPLHPLICDIRKLLHTYWQQEDRLVSYSIFHLFFTLMYEESARDKQLIDSIPYVPTDLMDVMLYSLNRPYTQQLWQHITSLTPLHKLTYRFDRYEIDTEKQGTLYQYILNEL